MKIKIAIVAILVLFNLSLQAQYKNTIYLTAQPGDFGYGIRYDRSFGANGMYATFSRGNYKLQDNGYIKEHLRGSIGYVAVIPQKEIQGISFASIGIVYHDYANKSYIVNDINPEVFSPLSFELGVGGIINRFSMAFRMDLFKWEGCLDLGIAF